jgi:hypothetical protein
MTSLCPLAQQLPKPHSGRPVTEYTEENVVRTGRFGRRVIPTPR